MVMGLRIYIKMINKINYRQRLSSYIRGTQVPEIYKDNDIRIMIFLRIMTY